MLTLNIDVQWQVLGLNGSLFPRLMLRVERYRKQVRGMEARTQVLKPGSGLKEDAAAKEMSEVSDVRGA